MTLSLSLSTNPLINRAADPVELVRLCSEEIGISRIQLTNEFISPTWPIATQARLIRQFAAAAARHNLCASSLMTGAQARLCAMGHPDKGVRQWSEDWLVGFGRIAADLGTPAIGSQFAILSWADWDNPTRREALTEAALDGWCRVWDAVAPMGVKWLFWEQMSIGREFGHTIAESRLLCDRIKARGIPLKLLLDVDHGDISSPNPEDTDPFAWIKALGKECPILHVKQSSANKGGHWPFVEPYNGQGRIRPAEIAAALSTHGPEDCEVCLELSFREREPADRQVVAVLRESVAYWRPTISA